MELALESVLRQRSALLSSRRQQKRSIALSATLHLLLALSMAIAPLLFTEKAAPINFTPITIVPIQALGVPEPVTPAPRREPQQVPKPEPQPKAPEPEPATERQVLPSPEKKPTEKRELPAAAEVGATAAGPPAEALGQRQGSPTGSSLGTSAFGAAVGGFDNPDFVYGYYVDQMLAMIGANWERPPLGADVEAVIHFRIHRDGHISDVRVLQSSGYNSYDLAGLRAVQLAAPFPKLPQSYKHSSLGVNLILR